MQSTGNIRELVATLMLFPAEQLGPDTSLKSLNTSLGRTRLRLSLERLGLALPADYTPTTFGELEAALSSGAAPVAPAVPAPAPKPNAMESPNVGNAAIRVGLDVQDIRSLPYAIDYWEHEFYKGMFGKTEIAYAVAQTEPRVHLAGFWCAKEALRKCDAAFTNTGLQATVVAHDNDGKPYLVLVSGAQATRLPHALSISHTNELASAVVVQVERAAQTELPAPRPTITPSRRPEPKSESAQPKRSLSAVWAIAVFIALAWIGLRLLGKL